MAQAIAGNDRLEAVRIWRQWSAHHRQMNSPKVVAAMVTHAPCSTVQALVSEGVQCQLTPAVRNQVLDGQRMDTVQWIAALACNMYCPSLPLQRNNVMGLFDTACERALRGDGFAKQVHHWIEQQQPHWNVWEECLPTFLPTANPAPDQMGLVDLLLRSRHHSEIVGYWHSSSKLGSHVYTHEVDHVVEFFTRAWAAEWKAWERAALSKDADNRRFASGLSGEVSRREKMLGLEMREVYLNGRLSNGVGLAYPSFAHRCAANVPAWLDAQSQRGQHDVFELLQHPITRMGVLSAMPLATIKKTINSDTRWKHWTDEHGNTWGHWMAAYTPLSPKTIAQWIGQCHGHWFGVRNDQNVSIMDLLETQGVDTEVLALCQRALLKASLPRPPGKRGQQGKRVM